MDFILRAARKLIAIEVKTSRSREVLAGSAAFSDAFHPSRKLLIGGDGILVEEFLARPVEYWVA